MKTCGRDKKIGLARICYRYTFGMFWLFFSRLAFITSLFLIIARHIVLLRTKFLLTSLHIKKLFMIFLIGLLLGASMPDYTYAKGEKIPIIASQIILLLAEGNVMVRASGSSKWKDAIVGMRLAKGDSLKTGSDSWAGIAVSSLKYPVTIKEKTSINLVDFSPVSARE